MVEHSAVNRRVVGSNPTRGAIQRAPRLRGFFVILFFIGNTITIKGCNLVKSVSRKATSGHK